MKLCNALATYFGMDKSTCPAVQFRFNVILIYKDAYQSMQMVYLARRAWRRCLESFFDAYLIAKKINNEGEDCCSTVVFPEAWSVLGWVIAKFVKVLGQFHICDDYRLF